jgi:hypothetical protein
LKTLYLVFILGKRLEHLHLIAQERHDICRPHCPRSFER